jgi:hypothetical protein
MQSSYKHWKCFPDIYNMSTQKQAPFNRYTPLLEWGTGLEGGYVNLELVQNFISTSQTLFQIGMWCYLEFVFSSYEQYFIAMEHTRSKSDNNVQSKDSYFKKSKIE